MLRFLSSNKEPFVLVSNYFNSLRPCLGRDKLSGVKSIFLPDKASLYEHKSTRA